MLDNLLGITDSVTLAHEEERLSKECVIKAWNIGLFCNEEPGSFASLQLIHKILFQHIYDFAGKVRDVDISKSNFRFTPLLYLNEAIDKVEKMPQDNFEQIIEKYVEMNICHPFREGNGRATRIWLDIILKHEIKKVIDWSMVDKQTYLDAMQRSVVNDLEIKTLLKSALTDKINNRKVFMKGLDSSYDYEGYNFYISQNLKYLLM